MRFFGHELIGCGDIWTMGMGRPIASKIAFMDNYVFDIHEIWRYDER